MFSQAVKIYQKNTLKTYGAKGENTCEPEQHKIILLFMFFRLITDL